MVSVRETVGGTAGNFAIAASRIGLRATVYSSCSSSVLGGRLKEKVGGDCVELRVDASDGEWPVCTIASDGKKQVAYIYQGGMANWAPRYSEGGGEAYLHFTTGPPPAEYLKIARNWSGKAIIFDPSQEISYGYDRDTVREFLGLSTFVLVNRAELAHMVRISGMSEDEISREVTSVIVTEGDRGATILSDGRREHIGAFPVERPFDTVGAGDAFRAGFHLGLQRGGQASSPRSSWGGTTWHPSGFLTGRVSSRLPVVTWTGSPLYWMAGGQGKEYSEWCFGTLVSLYAMGDVWAARGMQVYGAVPRTHAFTVKLNSVRRYSAMPSLPIEQARLRKILDSRGNLTVEAELVSGKVRATASAPPSGASTGETEVVAFSKSGIDEAFDFFNRRVKNYILGFNALDQRGGFDSLLHEIDGTENFSNMGGNVSTALSICAAKLASSYLGIPLYRYVGGGRHTGGRPARLETS